MTFMFTQISTILAHIIIPTLYSFLLLHSVSFYMNTPPPIYHGKVDISQVFPIVNKAI